MSGTRLSERRQFEGSHLFLVRLQAEELEVGGVQWYGKVQRVVSGETYSFAGWPDLIEHLLTMLPNLPIPNKASRSMLPEDED